MEKEIIEIENAVRQAQLAYDVDFFEKILADNFKFVTPQGKIVTKRDDIDQYKSGHLKLSKVDIDDRNIDLFGSTAIVRFKVNFEGKAGDYSFSTNMLFTRAYAKIDGAWKMVAGHASDVND